MYVRNDSDLGHFIKSLSDAQTKDKHIYGESPITIELKSLDVLASKSEKAVEYLADHNFLDIIGNSMVCEFQRFPEDVLWGLRGLCRLLLAMDPSKEERKFIHFVRNNRDIIQGVNYFSISSRLDHSLDLQ